ncbi:MAG: RluA family pseudouridine synthase [Pirellulaceae bacterium]
MTAPFPESEEPIEDEGQVPLQLQAATSDNGCRLDAFLARELPRYSRVQLRKVIGLGGVTVDGEGCKVAYRLKAGQTVSIVVPPMPAAGPNPENIPLDSLYEDEHIIAVNKPPGMVVHPARGHWSGTLTSALAFHFLQLSTVGGAHRPGVVHRLDRDTSGVIVVAKTDHCHYRLAEQFADRTTEKEYFALTVGVPNRDQDRIEQPIGMHPTHRVRMAIRADHSTSRDAMTFYEVVERFDGFAAVRVLPKTGRTHQIRVHLAHIGCPVLCDKLYGGRAEITRGEIRRDPKDTTILLNRQALHACRIKLRHPETQQPIEFTAPFPADMAGVLEELRQYRAVKKR